MPPREIRSARVALGWSVLELAYRAGVNYEDVIDLESGEGGQVVSDRVEAALSAGGRAAALRTQWEIDIDHEHQYCLTHPGERCAFVRTPFGVGLAHARVLSNECYECRRYAEIAEKGT